MGNYFIKQFVRDDKKGMVLAKLKKQVSRKWVVYCDGYIVKSQISKKFVLLHGDMGSNLKSYLVELFVATTLIYYFTICIILETADSKCDISSHLLHLFIRDDVMTNIILLLQDVGMIESVDHNT